MVKSRTPSTHYQLGAKQGRMRVTNTSSVSITKGRQASHFSRGKRRIRQPLHNNNSGAHSSSHHKCRTKPHKVVSELERLYDALLRVLLRSSTTCFRAQEKAQWLGTLAALPGTRVWFPAPIPAPRKPLPFRVHLRPCAHRHMHTCTYIYLHGGARL